MALNRHQKSHTCKQTPSYLTAVPSPTPSWSSLQQPIAQTGGIISGSVVGALFLCSLMVITVLIIIIAMRRKKQKYSGGNKSSHDLGDPNAHYSQRQGEEVDILYEAPLKPAGQGMQPTDSEAYGIGGAKTNHSENVYTNVI